MTQSRKMSLRESIANVAIGLGIQCTAQFALFLFYGITLAVHATLLFGGIMTLLSLVRQYCVRRLFVWLDLRRPCWLYGHEFEIDNSDEPTPEWLYVCTKCGAVS